MADKNAEEASLEIFWSQFGLRLRLLNHETLMLNNFFVGCMFPGPQGKEKRMKTLFSNA